MTYLLQQSFNATQLGILFALMGLGLTLILGVLKFANFAYGSTYMLGGYVTYYAISDYDLPWPLAVLVSVLVLAVAGLVLQLLLNAPFKDDPDAQMIAGLGVYLLIKAAALLGFGSNQQSIPEPLHGLVVVGGVRMPVGRLLAIGIALALVLAVWAGLRYTATGRTMRAVSESPVRSSLLGISVGAYELGAMALGTGLSALAGTLLGGILSVGPGSDDQALFTGFILVVLAGFGSIWGAVLAGLILAFTQVFGGAYISSAYSGAFPFVILILVLVLRPQGLFGKGGRLA